jgi:hypothetical protein
VVNPSQPQDASLSGTLSDLPRAPGQADELRVVTGGPGVRTLETLADAGTLRYSADVQWAGTSDEAVPLHALGITHDSTGMAAAFLGHAQGICDLSSGQPATHDLALLPVTGATVSGTITGGDPEIGSDGLPRLRQVTTTVFADFGDGTLATLGQTVSRDYSTQLPELPGTRAAVLGVAISDDPTDPIAIALQTGIPPGTSGVMTPLPLPVELLEPEEFHMQTDRTTVFRWGPAQGTDPAVYAVNFVGAVGVLVITDRTQFSFADSPGFADGLLVASIDSHWQVFTRSPMATVDDAATGAALLGPYLFTIPYAPSLRDGMGGTIGVTQRRAYYTSANP